ncbi:FAD-dependent oxidoreductase [Rhizorhabdus histidinilytica]
MDIPSGFEGELIAAGMPGYDEARRVFDRRADKRPGAILRCRSVEDVRAALRFARDRRSPIAVRSGGHGFTGRSTIDDGVLIDLSAMDGVILDADRRTVRIEPGARTGRVLRATVPAGLAPVTCAGNDIGVVGAALFAGQGYLSPATAICATTSCRSICCSPTGG